MAAQKDINNIPINWINSWKQSQETQYRFNGLSEFVEKMTAELSWGNGTEIPLEHIREYANKISGVRSIWIKNMLLDWVNEK